MWATQSPGEPGPFRGGRHYTAYQTHPVMINPYAKAAFLSEELGEEEKMVKGPRNNVNMTSREAYAPWSRISTHPPPFAPGTSLSLISPTLWMGIMIPKLHRNIRMKWGHKNKEQPHTYYKSWHKVSIQQNLATPVTYLVHQHLIMYLKHCTHTHTHSSLGDCIDNVNSEDIWWVARAFSVLFRSLYILIFEFLQ